MHPFFTSTCKSKPCSPFDAHGYGERPVCHLWHQYSEGVSSIDCHV